MMVIIIISWVIIRMIEKKNANYGRKTEEFKGTVFKSYKNREGGENLEGCVLRTNPILKV